MFSSDENRWLSSVILRDEVVRLAISLMLTLTNQEIVLLVSECFIILYVFNATVQYLEKQNLTTE